jgi:hypothetical protein
MDITELQAGIVNEFQVVVVIGTLAKTLLLRLMKGVVVVPIVL